MSVRVSIKTFVQEQTGKIHIQKASIPNMDFYQCFCSLDRDFEPEQIEIDLDDEDLCETCVNSFLNERDVEDFVVEDQVDDIGSISTPPATAD